MLAVTNGQRVQGLLAYARRRTSARSRREGQPPGRFREATHLRKALICAIAVAKILYIIWFYSFGINLNLGDTVYYIDASNAEVFRSRRSFGFAYIATLIYSNPVLRLLVEALTIIVICRLVLKLRSDRQAVAVTCLLLLPTSLAFMTVASKELLVFLLICIVYRMSAWLGVPAFIATVFLKPSFAAIAVLPLVRRMGAISLYVSCALLVAAVLIPIVQWTKLYEWAFYSYLGHFRGGNLTYGDAGVFPFAPIVRVLGLDLGDMEAKGIVIGLLMFAVNLLVFYILVMKYGLFRGVVMFAVFVVAVMPYSVHNLGSAARYQAPLVCALVLNELLVRPTSAQGQQMKGRATLE